MSQIRDRSSKNLKTLSQIREKPSQNFKDQPENWETFMHTVQKHASVLGEDFAWGAKTCLSFGGRFCTVCINVPQFWGKILHGVHKRASVLGQTFA